MDTILGILIGVIVVGGIFLVENYYKEQIQFFKNSINGENLEINENDLKEKEQKLVEFISILKEKNKNEILKICEEIKNEK